MLREVKGDATAPQARGPKVIAHICNDIGGWGRGFVPAISKRCLSTPAGEATKLQASVHMPRIGCGLAGGTWERIEPLITRALGELPVTVYDVD